MRTSPFHPEASRRGGVVNVLFVNIPRRITRSIDSDSDTDPDSQITPDWDGW
ncbi:MAG: hypothetical protein PHF14_06050 [Verrucomicrobiota bacterium]|nr:hypothetical protein [Verrucomicrobiota bacterium]